jgi:hypothetical protein
LLCFVFFYFALFYFALFCFLFCFYSETFADFAFLPGVELHPVRSAAEDSEGCVQTAEAAAHGLAPFAVICVLIFRFVYFAVIIATATRKLMVCVADVLIAIARKKFEAQAAAAAAEAEKRAEEEAALAWAAAVKAKQEEEAAAAEALAKEQVSFSSSFRPKSSSIALIGPAKLFTERR